MRILNAFCARTRYMMLSECNHMLFRYRCQASRRIVQGHPEYFTEKQGKAVAAFLVFVKLFAIHFIKRMLYTMAFLWYPYRLLGQLLPEITFPYVRTVLYMFTVMNVFAGSMINPALYHLTKKEKTFLPYIRTACFYLNRLVVKMVIDAGLYTLCLWLIHIPFLDALAVSAAAALLRPAGEVITYLLREHTGYFRRVYASFVGVLMAGAVLAAYVLPYVNRQVSRGWTFVTKPYFTGICAGFAVIFLIAFCFLDYQRVIPEDKG